MASDDLFKYEDNKGKKRHFLQYNFPKRYRNDLACFQIEFCLNSTLINSRMGDEASRFVERDGIKQFIISQQISHDSQLDIWMWYGG
jgi:hypothetical protein